MKSFPFDPLAPIVERWLAFSPHEYFSISLEICGQWQEPNRIQPVASWWSSHHARSRVTFRVHPRTETCTQTWCFHTCIVPTFLASKQDRCLLQPDHRCVAWYEDPKWGSEPPPQCLSRATRADDSQGCRIWRSACLLLPGLPSIRRWDFHFSSWRWSSF